MADDDAGKGYGKGSRWRLASGSWRIQFYLDGQRHHEVHPTEQAAAARLEEVARLKAENYDVGRGLQTVQQFYAEWMDQRARSSRAARTLDADRRNVDAYIMPAIGDRRMVDVRAAHLIALLNGVADDIHQRSGGKFAGTRTVQLVATLLTQAFDAAAKQRAIPFSPMDGVEVPTYDRAEVEPPTDAQMRAVLDAAAEASMPALWYFYVLLGLRRNEGLGLRVQDIDLKRRTLHVYQQVVAADEGLTFGLPKGKKRRLLPLPLVAVPWAEQRITQVKAAKLKAGPAWAEHDALLFCGPTGRAIWPTTADHWWKGLRAAAGLPETMALHHLRHGFMSLLDEASITEAMKGRIMGHAKKNVTQRYTHPTMEAMRRAVEEVAGRVLGADDASKEATG